MKPPIRHFRLITGVCAIVAGLLAAFTLVVVRGYGRYAKDVLASAEKSYRDAVSDSTAFAMFLYGRYLTEYLKEPKPVPAEMLREYARDTWVDEIAVVDRAGNVLVSTYPGQAGSNLVGRAEAQELPSQENAVRLMFTRRADDASDRDHVGVAFPGGNGFVLVNFDRQVVDGQFEDFMFAQAANLRFAADGMFLCVNPATGLVTLPVWGHPDFLGRRADELGLDLGAIRGMEDGAVFLSRIGGALHYVRVIRIRSRIVLAAHSHLAIWLEVYWLVAIVGVLLALLAAWLTRNVVRMRDAAARIAELHEAEESRRAADMRMAASIQVNVLPRTFPPFPEVADRLDVYAMMEPAKEVGGDFYDIRRIGATKVQVTVADVSGKGVPGAMFMMRAKATLANCVTGRTELAKAVDAANRTLCAGNEDGLFVTAWIGVVDFLTGRVEYVNAGHNPPLVRRADGRVEWLASDNPDLPLAAVPDYRFGVARTQLSAGDLLYVYSDGVTEANDPKGRLYGEKALGAALAGARASAKEACLAVSVSLYGFMAGAEQSDDITMLAIGLRAAKPAPRAQAGGLFGRRISISAAARTRRRTFPATNASVPASAAFLATSCPGPDAAVIIDEIASNIVRCSGATSFTVEVKDDREVTISDDGKPFNPLAIAAPDISASVGERKIGGLGIFIVKELAESIAYERRGDRNVLSIRLPPGPASSPSTGDS